MKRSGVCNLLSSVIVAAAALAVILLLAAGASAAGRGQVIVELQQNSTTGPTRAQSFAGQEISNTNNQTRKAYKFRRQREGKDFSYVIANLEPFGAHSVELSFVEHDFSSAGRRRFNVYLQGALVLGQLDIFVRAGGRNRAYQRTFATAANADGRITVRFRSDESNCKDYATVSTVRVFKGSNADVVEISASASRNDMSMPVRFKNNSTQNTFEALLGRLGSRFFVNLVPHRRTARFSSLGSGTADMAELIMGLNDGSSTRCLPFTDRFPAFEAITQSQTMTGLTYACSSPGSPLNMSVTFRAPFYPRHEGASVSPFIYIDVTVGNSAAATASGSFLLARPHKKDFSSSSIQEYATGTEAGYSYSDSYAYYDDTTTAYGVRSATEAMVLPLGETADVDFRGSAAGEFADFTGDSIWGFLSPAGYPKTYSDPRSPLFTFYPRGYSGAVWTITNLAPGESRTKHFVLSGYVAGKVLKVTNDAYSDDSFRFRYRQYFGGVRDVVNYAVNNRWAGDMLEEKSTFFDTLIYSDSYLQLSPSYRGEVRDLIAQTFQNFLVNTWWANSDQGRQWFSVWEGTCCRYHSTIDVEYNHAWFYFQFWPDLLRLVMDEWLLYPQSSARGVFLSHDMGWNDAATGQAYPHNMAVEENANYVLLLHKYWRTTGDTAYMRSRFSTVRRLVDFMINCDLNNNGLPDVYVDNTIDQGSPAIQSARDQTYLGVKCMSAYQAAREMASACGEGSFEGKCRARVEQINQTLAQDLWLSDHFAVCLDGKVEPADLEAYSIYPSNGLLYLLSSRRDQGITSDNLERIKIDMREATEKTLKKYGCTHSSYDAYNEWVSQNLWRDQIACRLGVDLVGGNPLALSRRYWSLQQYFGRNLNGGFWDVVIYPGGGAPSGASARTEQTDGPVVHTTGGGGSGYGQSLGYYPRGATSLGLIDAVAGLMLDVPNDILYYRPSTYPLKVPVLGRADWSDPVPSRRVPTLYWGSPGSSPQSTNRHLLPSRVRGQAVKNIELLRGVKHALSPDGDGVNDQVTLNYELPKSARVGASVWEGTSRERRWPAQKKSQGKNSLNWDGTDDEGRVVGDGIYTARVDAEADDGTYSIRPWATELWVNRTVPDLSREWYLAEGFTGRNATGGEFEEYVLIQNPGPEEANTRVVFMLSDGSTLTRDYRIPASSRFTVTVDRILPDAEVSTYVKSDRRVAVERAMYFNGRRAGHASIGVSKPGKTWYLAEGYTAQGFDEYILIQNPGDNAADVDVTFMTPDEGNVHKRYRVRPHSRFTIHVDKILPGHEVSTALKSSEPIVVERAQYLNEMKSGTCSIAAASTSRTWYLAEGYTDQGFEEYVLIQNPTDTYNDITVTFMEKTGRNTVKNYDIPPLSRFTISVDELLPASELSVKVRAENPVLVERAMYWNERSDGHAFIGTPTPDTEWYLAEGYTAQGFETWVLIQNPGDSPARVSLTFMEPSGATTVREYGVEPRSRFTVGLDEIFPASEVSTRVSSSAPIIVERAVYFNERSGGTGSLGIRGY